MIEARRIPKIILALAFLALSWLWGMLDAAVRAVIAAIPLEAVKRAVATFMARLPPYPTLFVFLIPLLAPEAIKIAAIWLAARHRWVLAAATYGFAELMRYGLAAFLFSTCKEKLLSIPWFRWLYLRVMAAHDWAHAQVAPLRERARVTLARWRATLAASGWYSGAPLTRRLGALWRHARALLVAR
jgi:hypothetical protein